MELHLCKHFYVMNKELEWKWIKGFEGMYKIYRDGRVWSERTKRFRKQELMKAGNGYYMVGLWNNYKRKQVGIHRLVAEAFVSNPNKYKEVDHINRDSRDNKVENLRWATRGMNVRNKVEKIRKNNRTGYIGVYQRESKRWTALIGHKYKVLCIGTFDTANEAALAYNRVARELRGELAYQNIV